MKSREIRQAAYAQFLQKREGQYPRYRLTQEGLPESERLALKVKLFIRHHLVKIIEKEMWHDNALERSDAAIRPEKRSRSMGNA